MSRLTFTHGGHRYKLDGQSVPSVTKILGLLAKPALTAWAANMAADYAIDYWDDLAGMPPSERRAAIAKAPERSRNRAAAKGTQIHAWADALIAGQAVEIPEQYVATVERFARWWEASKFVPVAAEAAVYADADEVYGTAYAGRFDMLASHPSHGVTLLDWKTGKGVYSDYGVQLGGYMSAEVWAGENGKPDAPMPRIDTPAVAHVREDGVTLHLLDKVQARTAVERWEVLRALYTTGEPVFTEMAEGVA